MNRPLSPVDAGRASLTVSRIVRTVSAMSEGEEENQFAAGEGRRGEGRIRRVIWHFGLLVGAGRPTVPRKWLNSQRLVPGHWPSKSNLLSLY